LIPYNNVQYKWNQNLVDNNRFLAPPLQSKVQPALEIVQNWLDFKAIAGADFVKTCSKRICSCWWYKFKYYRNHNIRTTEGGQRITLFETDNVNKKDANVKRFVQTIQHEYIHILNQTRPFDEKTLAKITQLVIHQTGMLHLLL
jgi:substrate import-associated zinc metallohydrolase lipoprotein